MTAQRATAGSILLLIALAVLFMPTGAAGSLKQHPAIGINISSDKTTYTCSPSCTATITITNNGTINGTLRNMT
ncbi:MAG: hypothetical protein SVU32_07865, partial [Candidatus Nanohaloarchaea archaeon]|nr:hypothetical protein [Candidatus Nanohaloarchaea archaeon]